MPLVITNSLTGEKEPFNPINPPKVRMYVCGPTVYDDPHIGHIRGAFVFEVIRKYLQYRGHSVKFIRNITDVDDKIIEKARLGAKPLARQAPSAKHQAPSTGQGVDLKQACEQIASEYTNAYHNALEKLGIDGPDEEPKATEQIPKMIEMIQHLIGKGMAYAAQGSVYFSVNGFKEYGKLSHQSPEQLIKGHRTEPGAGKKNPLDFALWKSAKEEEPSWPSPWGPGRPGWHIECSVMSQAKFGSPLGETEGETLDIHGGGVDLVFPHHENEIAQSEACWDKPFANYWMHNGLLTVEGQKMSKSVGNVIGVEDILTRGYQAEDLKFFFLQSHYRSPVDFSWEKMKNIKSSRLDFDIFFNRCKDIGEKERKPIETSSPVLMEARENFEEAMDDDFNTPRALAVLFELLKIGNISLIKGNVEEAIGVEQEIKKLGQGVFGILHGMRELINKAVHDAMQKLKEGEVDIDSYELPFPDCVDRVVEWRDDLRKKKDFKKSDEVRAKLKEVGIIVEDGKEKSTWRWSE